MKKFIISLICLLVTILSIFNITYASDGITTNIQKSGDWEYVEINIPNCENGVISNIEHNSKGFIAVVADARGWPVRKVTYHLLFSTNLKEWSLVYTDTVNYQVSSGPFESFLELGMHDKKLLRVNNDNFYFQFYGTDKIITSDDGVNWIETTYFPPYPPNIVRRLSGDILFSNNVYIQTLLNNYPYIKYSLDGVNYLDCNFDVLESPSIPYDVYWLPYNNIFVSQGYGQTLYISNDGISWFNKKTYGSHGNYSVSVVENQSLIYSFHQQRAWYDANKNPTGHRAYCFISDNKGETWSNFSDYETKVNEFIGKNTNKAIGFFNTDISKYNNWLLIYGAKATATDTSSFIGYGCIDVVPTLVIYKPNMPPEIESVTYHQNKKLGDNTIVQFSISVKDLDNNAVTISGSINEKTKSTTLSNGNGTTTLEWNTKELGEGKFSNIIFTANDGKATNTYIYTDTLDIKYVLQRFKSQVETFIPEKANVQRFVIADTDNRTIDDNTENRTLINEIKSILEKKNTNLYFIGGNNQITKDLTSYFE